MNSTTALANNLGTNARAYSTTTLTDGELHALFHRHRLDQFYRHLDVVPRHHHLYPFGQSDRPSHIRCAHIELRSIPVEEGRVASTLFFGEHIHLRLEVLVGLDAS